MIAGTVTNNASTTPAPLSANPSRNRRRLRAQAPTIASAHTYRALVELGKALRTACVCRYLSDIQLRREIHVGLNVVGTWNSANDFILYGRSGEIATKRVEDQEGLC